MWREGDDLGDFESPYAIMNDYCIEGAQGIEIMKVYIEDVIPLVGVHGRSNLRGPGLESIGFIWYDDEKEGCDKAARRPTGRGNILSVNDAEALITEDMRRQFDIYESLLIEVDSTFSGDGMLEKMLLGDNSGDKVHEQRQKYLGQIEEEIAE